MATRNVAAGGTITLGDLTVHRLDFGNATAPSPIDARSLRSSELSQLLKGGPESLSV
jgi:hypothetical protein